MPSPSLLQRLKERKLVQWVLHAWRLPTLETILYLIQTTPH
jgi:hypothetical protein